MITEWKMACAGPPCWKETLVEAGCGLVDPDRERPRGAVDRLTARLSLDRRTITLIRHSRRHAQTVDS